MKTKINILIIFISFLMAACCLKNNKSKSANIEINIADTISQNFQEKQDSNKIKRQVFDTITSTIPATILSTDDLNQLSYIYIDRDSTDLIRFDQSKEKVYRDYGLFYLPKYKSYNVVITTDWDYDFPMYHLSIIHNNIINDNKSLSIVPESSTPDVNDGVYTIQKIEIYDDYTIKIDTENSDGHHVKKYTKYYGINDEGEFYEVKE